MKKIILLLGLLWAYMAYACLPVALNEDTAQAIQIYKGTNGYNVCFNSNGFNTWVDGISAQQVQTLLSGLGRNYWVVTNYSSISSTRAKSND